MNRPQGGATANAAGALGEQLILNMLVSHGFNEETKAERQASRAMVRAAFDLKDAVLPGIVYRQLPAFNSIFRVPFKADFMIRLNKDQFGLIEMKWQASAGSVDEKLAFWLLTLQELPKNVRPILVVLGDGVRPGALSWLKENQGRVHVACNVQETKRLIQELVKGQS